MDQQSPQLSKFSLHFEGRALDIALESNTETPSNVCKGDIKQVAWIAYKYAGFNHVSLANHPNHLHMSCKKDF